MADTMTEHRRLSVLKELSKAAEYTLNGSILVDLVRAAGLPVTHDQMAATLSWLSEHELVDVTDHGHVVIATATSRGVEVAHGRAANPGVKRPSARD